MTFTETFQLGPPQEDLFVVDQNAAGLLFGPAIGYRDKPRAMFPPATTSGSEVATSLDVPTGAVVDRAVVRVAASAPNRTPIGGVATVRAASGDPESDSDSMIIDFGVMRNVSGVEAPAAISRVAPWLGTSFDDGGYLEGALAAVTLQELQTERLLVEFEQSVTAAGVAAAHVTTSTAPADLDLFVAGTRTWFRQGVAPADFAEEVDITAAVQAAVAAGTSPVPVVLKARVPGHLELTPVGDVQFLQTYVVQFNQGDTTVADALEEGIVDVALPMPVESATWKIHRVVGTIAAEDRGPTRVLPPVGPEALDDAELTLDADRPIVVRVPTALLGQFGALTAVRVRLTAGPSGIGVVGGLLGGTATTPGKALPGGEVTEVSVTASTAPVWVTLPFAKQVVLPVKETLWLSVAATRGRAVLGLRDVVPAVELGTNGQPLTDDERGIAVIRRITPNGVARPLSAPVGLRTDALALRLVGAAPDSRPIDLIAVGLASEQSASTVIDIATNVEPSDGPDRYVRALPVPAPLPGPRLRVTVTAATRLTVGPVLVAYQEAEERTDE